MHPLKGISVAGDPGEPALDTCIRHLAALGGVRGEPGSADIVFEREALELTGGGLVDSETTAQAALGLTDYIGPVGGRPARTGADVASSAAGYCGAALALASLVAGYERPLRVTLSPVRALSALKTILWAARTRPDDWTGTHVRSRERQVDSGYATRTGRITLDFPVGAEGSWRSFVEALGVDRDTIKRLEERWYESVGWGDDVDEAREVYDERLAGLDREQAIALIREHGGSSVPFLTPEECLAHPQSVALGLAESLELGLPWQMHVPEGAEPVEDPLGAPGRPLEGLRVVDFGVGGVGPFGATLLGWLGADVVKVEAPNEFILSVRPTVGSVSTTYLALNQGKRSVSLDLKKGPDIALARTLVADADVIVENFRPNALDRLGFGFDDVAALNPRVVYCSVTGFGSFGPLGGEVCTDPHMQAFSGFAWLNADPEEGLPRRVRYYGFVDLVTSCVVAEAICAALVLRRTSGGPVRVQTSMLQAVMDAQRSVLKGPLDAPDGLFGTGDGFIALTCRSDGQWRRLVASLGNPDDLTDARFEGSSDRLRHDADLRNLLENHLSSLPAAAWVHVFHSVGVPVVRALHDEEVLGRKELWDSGVLQELPLLHSNALVGAGPPWVLPGPRRPPTPAPLPGHHTEDLRSASATFWGRS